MYVEHPKGKVPQAFPVNLEHEEAYENVDKSGNQSRVEVFDDFVVEDY